MPHNSDSDVTALALARIVECRNVAAAYRATDKVAMTAGGVVLLAEIAAAAVRLTRQRGRNRDQPWWVGNASQVGGPMCIGCYGLAPMGGDWTKVDHAASCPAPILDAAIRAAGEATP